MKQNENPGVSQGHGNTGFQRGQHDKDQGGQGAWTVCSLYVR